jgi:hypothetical protein
VAFLLHLRMAGKNTSLNQKKILVSIYVLVAMFLSASLGIVIYFAVVTALSSQAATVKAGHPSINLPASALLGNSTSNATFEESLNGIIEIYPVQNHADALLSETVFHDVEELGLGDFDEEVDEGVREESLALAVREEEEGEGEEEERDDQLLPELIFEDANVKITNLFRNSRFTAIFLFSPNFQSEINSYFPVFFSSVSIFQDFASRKGMNVFAEYSVLTNNGSRISVLIAAPAPPTNISNILEAIRTGKNDIPRPHGNHFILYYERTLGSNAVQASLSQEYNDHFVEFKRPFGLKNSSALVLGGSRIILRDLDPKIMSSEPVFAQFAAEKAVPAIVKSKFLVEGLEHILILATSSEKRSEEVIQTFTKLLSWLSRFYFNSNPDSDDEYFSNSEGFLIAIVYPSTEVGLEYFRTLRPPSTAICDASSGAAFALVDDAILCPLSRPLELQRTSVVFFRTTYTTMVFAVRNVFRTGKRALLFRVTTRGLAQDPDSLEFSENSEWETDDNLSIASNRGSRYTVYIKRLRLPSNWPWTSSTPVSLEVGFQSFKERIATKLVNVAARTAPHRLNENFVEALNEQMDWPAEDFQILLVPE